MTKTCGLHASEDQKHKDESMNGILEEEGSKTNSVCIAIRDLLKREVGYLTQESERLSTDDSTLVRMINFFNEYKKRYEEWLRKRSGQNQPLKPQLKLRVSSRPLVAKSQNSQNRTQNSLKNSSNKLDTSIDTARRTRRLAKLKLDMTSNSQNKYPELKENGVYPQTTSDHQSDVLRRLNNRLKGIHQPHYSSPAVEEGSIGDQHRVGTPSIHSPGRSSRESSLHKPGFQQNYEPDAAQNVFYVQDASLEENHSQDPQPRYYLTDCANSATDRKKVTLNLRITKSKLKDLKRIRTVIRMNDTNTNTTITKERVFDVSSLNSSQAGSLEARLRKHLLFKHNGDMSLVLSGDKATPQDLSTPNTLPESKGPVTIEKAEFEQKIGGKYRSSTSLGDKSQDKQKGSYFILVGDSQSEVDADCVKHYDNHPTNDQPKVQWDRITSLEFLHSPTTLFAVDIGYCRSEDDSSVQIQHHMIGDVQLNTLRLDRTRIDLAPEERITSIAGVFGAVVHSLQISTSLSKFYQINDFLRHYEQSYETKYDFDVDETIAYINSGFLSSFLVK